MSVIVEADERKVTNVALTAQERDEVRLALGSYVSELHTEIVHTDRYEFRQALKERRALLQGVIRRLGGEPTAAAG